MDGLRTESRKGIAAVAALGAVGAGGTGPGEIGIDVGIAGYKGEGAVATNLSYTTERGIVLNAGVAYAGSGATVARVGIGLRFKLGNKGAQPVVPPSSQPVSPLVRQISLPPVAGSSASLSGVAQAVSVSQSLVETTTKPSVK